MNTGSEKTKPKRRREFDRADVEPLTDNGLESVLWRFLKGIDRMGQRLWRLGHRDPRACNPRHPLSGSLYEQACSCCGGAALCGGWAS